jgi:metal-responsive CopG/Arc/MetJ family transcriptional regulator
MTEIMQLSLQEHLVKKLDAEREIKDNGKLESRQEAIRRIIRDK